LRPELRIVRENDRADGRQLGSAVLRGVNHSIPDALAVALRTSGGTVLHTGDFKMDQTPLDGRITDLPGFLAGSATRGVDLLLSDSTNSEVPGFIPSEREVGKVVADVITRAGGRVIVACFASHVHRVAAGVGRRGGVRPACRAGRTVDGAQHADRQGPGPVARSPRGVLVDLKDAEAMPVQPG